MKALRVEFGAIGTTACVVTERAVDLVPARGALQVEIDRIDRACSRFRPDSDVARVQHSDGKWTPVGDALMEALTLALRAAAITDGLVDPTVGRSIVALGYDRDFAALRRDDDATPGLRAITPPGWRTVELDVEAGAVRVPPGTVLDLGATAKALAVDRAARAAVRTCEGPVLIGIGGDLALAGDPPAGGWAVRIADRHDDPGCPPGMGCPPDLGCRAQDGHPMQGGGGAPCVALHHGALATSSTTVRRWRRGELACHHIVDPATGLPTTGWWRTVSVAASTCVDANTASTAAIVRGEDAPNWLAHHHLPARLVGTDGEVCHVGGWPAPTEDRAA